MWMTLLYIIAIAVVAVIVAIAVFYAAIFGVMAVGVLFGFKVAWKKRKFLVGLIPDEEMSAPTFAAGIVEAGITSAVNTVQKRKKYKNENAVNVAVKQPNRIALKQDTPRDTDE